MKKISNKLPWNDHDLLDENEKEFELLRDKYSECSSKTGLPQGWKRATFILKEEHINKLKACAYWERITLKELIEDVVVLYLENKTITDIPPKKQRSVN